MSCARLPEGNIPGGLQKTCLRVKNLSQNNSLQTLFGGNLILLQIRGFARLLRVTKMRQAQAVVVDRRVYPNILCFSG